MRYLTALLAACLSVASFAFDVPCLDPLACNFMEEGECFFTDENGDPCVIEGCTIEGACNYDPAADIYDGSCEFVSCLGCIDSEACNYDETALYDDATCIYYVDCNGTCGGDWIEDACGNCFSPETTIPAEFTFTTCGTSGRFGPSQEACNSFYGENAVEVVNGMQIWTAPVTGVYHIAAAGAQGGSANGWGLGATITVDMILTEGDDLIIGVGQMGQLACESGDGGGAAAGGGGGSTGVFNAQTSELLLIAAGGGGQGLNQYDPDNWSFGSDNNAGNSTYSNQGQLVGAGGEFGAGGSQGSNPHGDWPQAGGGAGILSDGGNGGAFGGVAYGGSAQGYGGAISEEGNCQAEGGFGFTGGGASEHGGGGGGGYSGGGGGASANYYINGGGGGSYVSPDAENQAVLSGANTGDGFVSITWEVDVVPLCNPGCTHAQACNYNPESNFDDGSCDYCFCGEGTQWVDSLQACMVTEAALMQACGEGTYWDDLAQACLTIQTCQEDLDGDGIVGVNDLLELLSSFGSECVIEPETAEWTCGDAVNYHGYDYATVQIGEQCWFSENMRTTLLSDSSSMSEGVVSSEPGWESYDGNTEISDKVGYHYNYFAALDVCPNEWHLPTFSDFENLVSLINTQFPCSEFDIAGKVLKINDEGSVPWDGSNSVGFNGLAGGYISANTNSYSYTAHGTFWLDNGESEFAGTFGLSTGDDSVNSFGTTAGNQGKSVRCIKDSE